MRVLEGEKWKEEFIWRNNDWKLHKSEEIKDIKIQEAQNTLNMINPKRFTLRYMTNCQKSKINKKSWKQQEQLIIFKEAFIRLSVAFSAETLSQKGIAWYIWSPGREKTANQE